MNCFSKSAHTWVICVRVRGREDRECLGLCGVGGSPHATRRGRSPLAVSPQLSSAHVPMVASSVQMRTSARVRDA